MDLLDRLRSAITLLSFLVFAAVWVWAWSRRNRDGFATAAQLPFAHEAEDIPS